jgi:YD repeat-containing protein
MYSLLIRTFIGALVFLCSGIYVYGQTFSLPSTNTTGTYSISFSHPSNVIGATVVEELVSGNWVSRGGGGAPGGTINVTKTQSGTYSYRARICTGSCGSTSATKSIVVTLSGASSSSGGCTAVTNAVAYCYDDLGRVKTVVHSNGIKNTYEYDSADNRIKKESTAN